MPFRVRIGVTGHRRLDDEARIAAEVRRVVPRIRELVPASPSTPVAFTVVSALAEGADRLVARELTRDDRADLEVALPLPAEDYRRDFATEDSRREFDELLGRATMVTEGPPSKTRKEAYERVGRYVVDRSDVLIAIWDGEPSKGPGGTARVVDYARERPGPAPLFWIGTKGDMETMEQLGTGISREALGPLDEYNRAGISQQRFRQRADAQKASLAAALRAGLVGLHLGRLVDWIVPYFVRADVLSVRYQKWYFRLNYAVFLLAAGAVAAVAAQAFFWRETPGLAWIEVAVMSVLGLIVIFGRLLHLHGRWISYRFLAERFRSAFFLAAAGLGDIREGGFDRVSLGHPSQEWIRRAYAEVWNHRPASFPDESGLDEVRRFVADAWVGGQIDYYRKRVDTFETRHRHLTLFINILFVITIVAAILHSVGVGHDSPAASWADLFLFISVATPALAGAISAIRMQGEYELHAERYRRMAYELSDTRTRMEVAPDLPTLRAVAAEAEGIMRDENREWFGVMRFQELETHV